MVLMCGFSFGVKESKLVLSFIIAGMILECPLTKICMIGAGDVKLSFFYMRPWARIVLGSVSLI